MSFSREICSYIKHYIYLYIDPRNNQIFYVGKGKDNRAFSHLSDSSESQKVNRISEIRTLGLQPIIEILIHGVDSDDEIRRIEASIIDLIGIQNLTNISRGYGAREYGRMTLDQLKSLYESDEAVFDEPALLININKTYYYGISDIELYDATRSSWVVGKNKDKVKYAFAVYEGIIKEAYEIKGWFPGNSTFNVRNINNDDCLDEERWEFVGKLAENSLRDRIKGKSVLKHMGPRNPINYINIE